ncbi:hypothetical protein ACWV26_02860 [Rummeliibacillus sp. JY-2-4R]
MENGDENQLESKNIQEQFKEILLYGYKRGNEDRSLSAQDLVQELTEKMRELLWREEYQD